MFNRIKTAWSILRGRIYLPKPSEVIYVQSSGPPRWVQLLNYQDRVLALDSEGTVWDLREDFYGSGQFVCQIMIESPRKYT
jgi:hypothetical protein